MHTESELAVTSLPYLSEDRTTQVLHMLPTPSIDQQAETGRIDGRFKVSSKLEKQIRDVGILVIEPFLQQALGPVILAQQKACLPVYLQDMLSSFSGVLGKFGWPRDAEYLSFFVF